MSTENGNGLQTIREIMRDMSRRQEAHSQQQNDFMMQFSKFMAETETHRSYMRESIYKHETEIGKLSSDQKNNKWIDRLIAFLSGIVGGGGSHMIDFK